jgi:hypothetical protein
VPRLVLSLVLLLVVAAPAARAATPEIGIADDRILLNGGPVAERAVAEWSALGVENVRIFAHWARIAPAAKPRGFRPSHPNDPHYEWFRVDDAVELVRRAGMSVTLTVTGPGPAWTSRNPGRRQGQWKPRPAAFASFAAAVAKRYGSRVDRYVLWNEPNIWIWLSPQARCSRGRCTPVAPHLYRALVRAAYPAIADNDPVARIVIGALSPRGQRLRNANTVMRPLLFLRRLGCRTDAWRRMTTAECRGFRPAIGDGFAIHPYSGRIAPERRHVNDDDVGLAQIRALSATLDRLRRARALRSTTGRMGIYIDEYGYQTRPPDPIAGVSPRKQDAWLQRAAYLAWRTPRIKLFTQYLWRDEPRSPGGSFSGWQSGLRFTGGRAKPSLAHFDTPFVLDAARGLLWGQVRPGGSHSVVVERRLRGGGWRTFAVVQTDGRGYWSLRRGLTVGASYRYRAAGRVSAVRRR